MPKPTKQTVAAIKEDLMRDIGDVRRRIEHAFEKEPELERAWAGVETFCAVALRIIAKTNPSKIRDEARTTEIGARFSGRPVLADE
jgi:hypothetical protein